MSLAAGPFPIDLTRLRMDPPTPRECSRFGGLLHTRPMGYIRFQCIPQYANGYLFFDDDSPPMLG